MASLVSLYTVFIVSGHIFFIIFSRPVDINSILTIILDVLFIVGIIGVFMKKNWSPILVALCMIFLIPASVSNYEVSSGVRIGSIFIDLFFILLNILIYKQITVHNNIPHMRKLFKIPLIIVGILYILFTILISIPHILGLFSKDIKSVDESGLEVRNPNVQDSTNAYSDLIQLTGTVYLPVNKDDANMISNIVSATSSNPWNDNLVRDVISKNSKTLQLMNSASSKSILYSKEYSDVTKLYPDMVLTHLNDWRNAGKISLLNALYLQKQGKNIEALEQSIKTMKVGYLISESNQTLIGYLVGTAIKNMSYNVVSKIIKESHLSVEQKTKYSTQLNPLMDDGQGLKNAFILEYYFRVNGLSMYLDEILSQGNIPKFAKNNSYYFKLNKTKQLDVDYTREQIKNLDIACDSLSSISDIQNKKIMPSVSLVRVYFTENVVGKILHDVVSSSLSTVYIKRCESNAKLSTIIQLLNH